MKSELINKVEKQSVTYPVLLQLNDDGVVVLFTANKNGIVVKEGSGHQLGEYRTDWTSYLLDNWKVYTGKVVLSNE